jgi:predicted aspartyl protease
MSTVTIPMTVEYNRPFIDLEFRQADGKKRTACTWVDTGGGTFHITESLAHELGFELGEVHGNFAKISEPEVFVKDLRLDVSEAYPSVQLGATLLSPGFPAEAFIPGRVLKNYHVIFDYPNETFTLAEPGSVQPRGSKLSTPISFMGFPHLELEIRGERYGFLLDTGASYTMVSKALLEKLGLKQTVGAVAEANMGVPAEENLTMARIDCDLGDVELKQVGVVARPEGIFENYMSEMMTAPIVGAIAGNVLKALRVEIDYAQGYTYLEQTAPLKPNDLDVVGIVLRPEKDGSYTIAGISRASHTNTLEKVKPLDKLESIEGRTITGLKLAQVLELLRGQPGEPKRLALLRDGQRLEAKVPVVRIL